jgi:hypothetical protein
VAVSLMPSPVMPRVRMPGLSSGGRVPAIIGIIRRRDYPGALLARLHDSDAQPPIMDMLRDARRKRLSPM